MNPINAATHNSPVLVVAFKANEKKHRTRNAVRSTDNNLIFFHIDIPSKTTSVINGLENLRFGPSRVATLQDVGRTDLVIRKWRSDYDEISIHSDHDYASK
jgi:hypothetical protein